VATARGGDRRAAGGKRHLAENQGEYDSEFTINAGSYYEKAYSAMLLTESVDNFISGQSRDFVDARYRAVSMADLFPEGYRRWLANNLTNDDEIKGSWVRANGTGPIVDADSGSRPHPIGWTSWWTAQPEVCFPAGRLRSRCRLGAGPNPEVMAIDPRWAGSSRSS
jgi:hypothetical protein